MGISSKSISTAYLLQKTVDLLSALCQNGNCFFLKELRRIVE